MNGPDPTADAGVAEARRHLSALARSELQLARAELAQGGRRFANGLALGVMAAVFALVSCGALSAALIGWLVTERGVALWAAAACVGVGELFLAIGLAVAARRRLDIVRLLPWRSFANVKRDFTSLKEALNG